MSRGLRASFSSCIASVHPAVMGTWCTNSKVASTCAGCAPMAAPCQEGKESAEHACKAWLSDHKLVPLHFYLLDRNWAVQGETGNSKHRLYGIHIKWIQAKSLMNRLHTVAWCHCPVLSFGNGPGNFLQLLMKVLTVIKNILHLVSYCDFLLWCCGTTTYFFAPLLLGWFFFCSIPCWCQGCLH